MHWPDVCESYRVGACLGSLKGTQKHKNSRKLRSARQGSVEATDASFCTIGDCYQKEITFEDQQIALSVRDGSGQLKLRCHHPTSSLCLLPLHRPQLLRDSCRTVQIKSHRSYISRSNCELLAHSQLFSPPNLALLNLASSFDGCGLRLLLAFFIRFSPNPNSTTYRFLIQPVKTTTYVCYSMFCLLCPSRRSNRPALLVLPNVLI